MRRALAPLLAVLAVTPAGAQEPVARERTDLPAGIALQLAPPGVQHVVRAADSILSSGLAGQVSLEAFDSGISTGVYLHGTLHGEAESVGYGRDPGERRYLWLSVGQGDSLEHMAMLYDVDHDLTPDFLLVRVVDQTRRTDSSTEYRDPSMRDVPFEITLQPICAPPRCDPATWTIHDRARVDVPEFWFEMWRPVLSLAAMRGERWLGRPVASLPAPPSP